MKVQKIRYGVFFLCVVGSVLAENKKQEVAVKGSEYGPSIITEDNVDEIDIDSSLIYNEEGEVVGVAMDKLKELGVTIEIEHDGNKTDIMPKGLKVYDAAGEVAIDPNGNTFEFNVGGEDVDIESLSELEQFAVKTHLHGFAYEDVERFKGKDLNKLVGLLNDNRWKTKWSQIAIIIGMLGERGETSELLEFIKRHRDTDDRAIHKALRGAYAGLGYLSANAQSSEALEFLLAEYHLPNDGSDKASKVGYNDKLIDLAVARGLAVSANKKAIEALLERKEVTRDDNEKHFLEAQINRAIDAQRHKVSTD